MSKIRVAVVDDQHLMRRALKVFVEHEDDLECIGEASNGEEALTLCEEARPDVVLLDLQMPVMDGVEATTQITNRFPDISVVAVTTFTTEQYLIPTLQAGARGYLVKDAQPEEIVNAIRSAHQGTSVLSASVSTALIAATRNGVDRNGDQERNEHLAETLTPREMDVLQLVGRGMNNAEIAAELFLSQATVKVHIGNLFAKLGARDRVQTVVIAAREGLIDINTPAS